MSRDQSTRSREHTALLWLCLDVPGALVGLALPFHDYAGLGGPLEDSVSNDSLMLSAVATGLAALVAAIPVALWPPRWTRAFAVAVLALTLFNLLRVLSYYWWRGDLVVSSGGGC